MNLATGPQKAEITALGAAGFAECFGIPQDQLPKECLEIIANRDFSYRRPDRNERDAIILDALKRLEGDAQKIGAPGRRDVWESGWREALNEYVASDFSEAKLVPKFIRPNQPIRLRQDYAVPSSKEFELQFVEVLRKWMFRAFFADANEVHEFGCGTGFNLLSLADIYPEKRLFGSDFVPASVELANRIAKKRGLNLSATLFDMITPPASYEIGVGAAIFTFGALEQLASRFEKFLAFLLDRHPALCLHVEPTVELYDEGNLVDHLAIRFHRKRGYTEGFLPRLQALAAEKRVELLRVQRMQFGSLMMEGYNLIVWRPLG